MEPEKDTRRRGPFNVIIDKVLSILKVRIHGMNGNELATEIEDGEVATGQNCLIVINLNYVWDGAKWVPMTQP